MLDRLDDPKVRLLDMHLPKHDGEDIHSSERCERTRLLL